ncbi:MAG: hypothetical protein PHO30_08195 [Candidatus Omnitrophica bacterium]|jgi:hypothetical protein|nr:hypothetical protein [Candidatus Omnitrophota bacterium]
MFDKETSFISTTPLDILAGIFCLLSILGCTLCIVALVAVLVPLCPININYNTSGYTLLVTNDLHKNTLAKTGYGIMTHNGIRIWKYQRQRDGSIKEIQIFPR